VVGISIARELKARQRRRPKLCLLEKEPDLRPPRQRPEQRRHSRGPFITTADSLKARLTRDGNRQAHGLLRKPEKSPVNKCGKPRRGRAMNLNSPNWTNSCGAARPTASKLQPITADEARAHRTARSKTFQRAHFFSPSTSDPPIPSSCCKSMKKRRPARRHRYPHRRPPISGRTPGISTPAARGIGRRVTFRQWPPAYTPNRVGPATLVFFQGLSRLAVQGHLSLRG